MGESDDENSVKSPTKRDESKDENAAESPTNASGGEKSKMSSPKINGDGTKQDSPKKDGDNDSVTSVTPTNRVKNRVDENASNDEKEPEASEKGNESFNKTILANISIAEDCTMENLISRYEADHESFFKGVAGKLKVYTAKMSMFDLEQIEISQDRLLNNRKDIQQIIEELTVYGKFMSSLHGLLDDSQEDLIVSNDVKLSALRGLYLVLLGRYNSLIDSDGRENVSEKKSDNDSASPEKKSDKDSASPKLLEGILPTATPSFAKRTLTLGSPLGDVYTKMRNTRQKETETGSENRNTESRSSPSNQHQSTPITRNRSQVRFSSVIQDYTIQDPSISTQSSTSNSDAENSWKFVEPATNMIQEISIVEDFKAISTIIQKRLSEELSDVEIVALDKRERVKLVALKESIERKSVALPDNCNTEIKSDAVKAFKAATKWLSCLDDLITDRNLHLESERRHAKPLELEKFHGHTDVKTNVYEFFKLYEIISRGFTKEDKAYYLYANYLEEEIKMEVRHVRNDYGSMKQLLIRKHGNINTLLMHKKTQIKKLKTIHLRSTRGEKIKYVKSFCEVLDQISSLVEVNKKDFPLMNAEVYSYNNSMELANLLPEFLFRNFTSSYVVESSKCDDNCLSGKRTFDVLVDCLRRQLKELELAEEVRVEETREKFSDKPMEKKEKTKQKMMAVKHANVNEKSTQKSFDSSKYYGAPCIAHKEVKMKVRDCLSGKCSTFLKMKPETRYEMAEEKNVCKLCLVYKCQKLQDKSGCLFQNVLPSAIICSECNASGQKINVLLCSKHKHDTQDVQDAIREFLPGYVKGTGIELMMMREIMKLKIHEERIAGRVNNKALDVSTGKTIPKTDVQYKTHADSPHRAVYPMQILNLGGIHVQVLYDSGANGEAIKADVAEKLNLTVLDARSQKIAVAGGNIIETECPMYEMTIGPNDRGEFFTFPLLGLKRISDKLPEVDLTKLENRVRKELVSFPEAKSKYPEKVGGKEIELIIGIRQSNIFPTREYVFEDGMQVWKSPFRDIYGSNLIFAGPCQEIENSLNFIQQSPSFFQEDLKFHKIAQCLTPLDELKIGRDCFDYDETTVMKKSRIPRNLEKQYEEEEKTGCTVDYRCPSCNGCLNCKKSDKVRAISIKDEAEEELIMKSVEVDVENKVSKCVYPFTEEPQAYLTEKWGGKRNNFEMARKIFESQRKKPDETRQSVVRFHKEIHEKGFVAPLSDLKPEVQCEIKESEFQHYFCWRSVFKADSISTPSRLVVDPGHSNFNDIIAKGSNCLTSLYAIIINWRSYLYAFSSDISKMFNTIKLKEDMFKYSLYLFSESLDPKEDIEIWVNLTLMYGLRSAANQASFALRETANLYKEKFPMAFKVIHQWTYMDDSSGGSNKNSVCDDMIKEVEELLPCGGFSLKVITKSGEDPTEKASSDGVSTSFAGYKWKPKEDNIMLKSGEINFNPKRRGIKKDNKFSVVTNEDVELLVKDIKFTRRNLLGKTLELFDLVGIWEPLKVRLKLDLHKLLGLEYDEEIPLHMRGRWIENLKLINEARSLQCRRAVVPIDAVNPEEIDLLVCSDAATTMCGCAIYARFKRKNGDYSCQLLTSRSRTTTSTIPRNELEGCLIAAQTTFTVQKALEDRVKNVIFVTDSTISLCWISNEDCKLKQFVNSRVKEIHRLVGKDDFYHVSGDKNPADILTRGDIRIEDLREESCWQKGEPWMKLPLEEMPIQSYSDICSSMEEDEIEDFEKETHPVLPALNSIEDTEKDVLDDLYVNCNQEYDVDNDINCNCLTEMIQQDSKTVLKMTCKSTKKPDTLNQDDLYLVDFVKLGFERGFLRLAYVMRFVLRCKHKVHERKQIDDPDCQLCEARKKFQASGLERILPAQQNMSVCSPLDFYNAWHYICKIGSNEVKIFYSSQPSKLRQYEEKDDVLFGAGRLSYPKMKVETDPMIFETDFYQPVFLMSSVVTYAIVMYVHWKLCPHSGVESTMSTVLRILHVKNLRKLVKYVRETCPRCRYLLKKHYLPLVSNQTAYSLMRAPPFFCCMIDIAGTFQAHDSIKRRVTKEAYFLVQVCLITGAVTIGVLEDLSVSSIVLALTRAASRYGWSKYLILDNQSSFRTLENARFGFKDLAGRLWTEQKLILDFSTPFAHNEHGRVEAKIKILKDFLNKAGCIGRKHSYLEWETVCLNISATINGLPICHNQDERSNSASELGLITPNMFLIGRNNNRSPEKIMTVETNPAKALRNIAETSQEMYDLLESFVHRFIPGKKFSDTRSPEKDDIVLFVAKEAERSRNVVYKYGRVIETCVDGRINKVTVEYRNPDEVVKRRVHRNIKDLVLILGSDELDFNTNEHRLAIEIQQKFL